MADICYHKYLQTEVVDQTLGVACKNCDELVGYCWMNRHVSERMWNRGCAGDEEHQGRPCRLNRTHICFLCGSVIFIRRHQWRMRRRWLGAKRRARHG